MAKARSDGMRGFVVVPFTPSDPTWPALAAALLTSVDGQRDPCIVLSFGVEAGVAVEATCFTGTDKQAATYSISRLITDASLVLISHDPAAQGACNFTGCNAPLTAAR